MKNKQKLVKYLPVILDACFIIIAYFLAYYLRFYRPIFREELGYYYPLSRYVSFLLYIVVIDLIIYHVFRLYSAKVEGRLWKRIVSLTLANLVGMILFISILYFWKENNISRMFLLLFLVINIALGIASRMVMEYTLKRKQK